MPLVKTVNELEIAWLKAALGGSSKTNLTELQWLFYSANSGLSSVAKYSLQDHQKAFYAAQSGVSAKNSITDLERAYFNSKGSLSSQSYQDQAYKHWRDIPFILPSNPNLLSAENSSFEGGTTGGWGSNNGGALSNSALQAFHGTKSLQIGFGVAGGRGGAVGVGLAPVTAGLAYTLSAYAYITDPTLDLIVSVFDGLNFPTGTVNNRLNTANTWTRVSYTGIAAATGNSTCYIDMGKTTTGFAYIDGIKFEQANAASVYP